MNLIMQQSNFSHAKCLNCKHFGLIESFNPKLVDIKENNHQYIKFSIDEDSKGMIQTINFNCPICNSSDCESYFPNEVN